MNVKISLLALILFITLFTGPVSLNAHPIEPAKKEQSSKQTRLKKSKIKQWKKFRPNRSNAEGDVEGLLLLLMVLAFLTFLVAIIIGIYGFWFWSWVVFLGLNLSWILFSSSSNYQGKMAISMVILTVIVNILLGVVLLILGLSIGEWIIWAGAIFMILMGVLGISIKSL